MIAMLVMYLVFGGLLAALAIPLWLGKVPPNPIYGVRVPSTLRDPDVWYKTNSHMARGLFATGLITALAALLFYFVPGMAVDTYAWLCLAAIAVPLTVTIIDGMRYLRRLPK